MASVAAAEFGGCVASAAVAPSAPAAAVVASPAALRAAIDGSAPVVALLDVSWLCTTDAAGPSPAVVAAFGNACCCAASTVALTADMSDAAAAASAVALPVPGAPVPAEPDLCNSMIRPSNVCTSPWRASRRDD